MKISRLKTIDEKCFSVLSVLPIFFATVLFFVMLNYDPYEAEDKFKAIVPLIPIGASLILGSFYLTFMHRFGKLNEKRIIAVLFLIGFALRLAYCLRYNYTQNQHDVESLVSNGHLSYINILAKGEGLPKTNDWQFCHPPLHHFLSSLVVKFSWSLGLRNAVAFENVQLLTCFYSALLMFAAYSLLKEFKVEGRALAFGCAFIAFNPTFFILAGSINNDVLTVLLSVYALLFLVKWYKKPSVWTALTCGIFTGLAMMTKFSAALVAVVAALTVLFKLFTDKGFKFGKFAAHTGCFLGTMLPLGLWYQIRNMYLFKQPLGYVAPLSTESKLYIGDMSLADRILIPFSSKPTEVYVDVWKEHNLWQYLARNSLFGEYNFGSDALAMTAVLGNLLVTVAVIFALVLILIRFKKDKFATLPVVIMFVVQWAFFVYFNITSPFRCSMDFRYIVPVLFCSAVFMGVTCMKTEMDGGVVYKIFNAFCEGAIILLCASSVLIFI